MRRLSKWTLSMIDYQRYNMKGIMNHYLYQIMEVHKVSEEQAKKILIRALDSSNINDEIMNQVDWLVNGSK